MCALTTSQTNRLYPVDEAGIRKPAFKIGVAFRDERGLDLLAGCSRQPELLEFINVAARRIANSHDLRRDVLRRDVDDTLLAPSKHLEAVVFVPDVAAYQRGLRSITMCQPIVMMLVAPFHLELTRTIGPGSRKRRTCVHRQVPLFVMVHIRSYRLIVGVV